ncbi:GRIP and coiled-coil domain-containing protein 1 isoform X2 [Nematostella vectensis]|uniref:GRIP and coiled-coil domain-containing protein 1 isoform X2 n=1 Tax=Nematostella vectensis TaxID=45351 RepID=UPI0020772F9C|nr:GRIP and coiled-coil domain-containing protein 1 isoform X2 [Nematostella vectensis]
MERKSRSELIKIIEAQKEQLSRYESKLRDVVHAYKNLLKEKEALDASIKVLTTAQQSHTKHPRSSKKKGHDASPVADGPKGVGLEGEGKPYEKEIVSDEKMVAQGKPAGVEVKDHPLAVNEPSGQTETQGNDKQDGPDRKGLSNEGDVAVESDDEDEDGDDDKNEQDQVLTLSSTLKTVMEQKAMMEANYQADKKKMMHDFEGKQKEMEAEREKLTEKLKELESQTKELKLRMRQEQQNREEEENNHALMLRELQLLLSEERTQKEELEQQLDDMKDMLESSKHFPESKARDYENCISQLRKELKELKERLEKAEEKSSKPSPLLVQLQEEMAEMKREHMEAVSREQKRANDAEDKLKLITCVEEDRVADLETKLSELSEVVGSYEKLRFHDQEVIHKLKERLQQLDTENTALTLHSPVGEGVPDNNIQTVAEIDSLRDQVQKLRTVLKLAVEKSSEKSIDQELEGLSKSELESILNSDPTHNACQQELRQLKDEFERYKAKTQLLHRSKSLKEITTQLEDLDKLKARNAGLEKRLKDMEEYSHQRENELTSVVSQLQMDLHTAEERYQKGREDSELIYRHKVSELEKQVVKQRERTLELIAEKDAEIESLRMRSPSSSNPGGSGSAFAYSRKFMDLPVAPQEGDESAGGADTSPDTSAAVYQLLSRQAGVSSAEPGLLIHYAQQQARRDAENSALRREKNDLEDDLRDCTLREAKTRDQCETLKEEIRKLERDRSRETANLEYLKNIILRFMMTTSYSVKEQMITAIATILQFSPKEVARVKKTHQGHWW